MTHAPHQPWLHRFAVLTVLATLGLIWMGGLVTSHGAGMAVPDWPTSYGYNMFYLPFSRWLGGGNMGVFYEHTHRLLAAGIGLLTTALVAWIWVRETQGRTRWLGLAVMAVFVALLGHRGSGQAEGGAAAVPAHFRALVWILPVMLAGAVFQAVRTRGALRWLAVTAFFAVMFQGVLGGMRVAAMRPELGIFHGTLAQLFLVLLSILALRTSAWWGRMAGKLAVYDAGALRYVIVVVTGIILGQLILGAAMRHQHAGLAIPDFPTAYGTWWPDTSPEAVARYNRDRLEVRAMNPITSFQIGLQMAHRLTALAIFLSVAWLAGAARSRFGGASPMARLTAFWFGLILLQVLLGAATIWTNKAADIATAHVAVGALSLVTGVLISVISLRAARRVPAPVSAARSRAGASTRASTVSA